MSDILALLAKHRRKNPPNLYNRKTGNSEPLGSATEDALILASSDSKRQAIDYIDALLEFSPETTDRDTLIKLAATKQRGNLANRKTELGTMVDMYEDFKQGLTTFKGTTDEPNISDLSEGVSPLLESLSSGLKSLLNRYDETVLAVKMYEKAEDRYKAEISDEQRKEWRSWKRVLSTYLV